MDSNGSLFRPSKYSDITSVKVKLKDDVIIVCNFWVIREIIGWGIPRKDRSLRPFFNSDTAKFMAVAGQNPLSAVEGHCHMTDRDYSIETNYLP
jgi:hypothetical protein